MSVKSTSRLVKYFASSSSPNLKKLSTMKFRKSWMKDRLICLYIFERARQIINLCTLCTIETFDLEQFMKQYDALPTLSVLDRKIGIDGSLDDLIDSSKSAHKSLRMIVAFGMMLVCSIIFGVTCSLIDRKFPISSTISNATDYLIMTIFTITAFIIIYKVWHKRARYAKLVNFMLRNLIELPAIYCEPVQQANSEKLAALNIGPNHSVRTFTMQPMKNRCWAQTMHNHLKVIILMLLYIVFNTIQLVVGSFRVLRAYENHHWFPCLVITIGYTLQAILFILYPLVNYSYTCFCVVLTVQIEHLNQYFRDLKERCGHSDLPLKEELDLARVWYARVAGCVLQFDRFGHSIFFFLYLAHIAAMMLKSIQVHLIFDLADFSVESYLHFVDLGLLCVGTILLMKIVYALNKSISKPAHYMAELTMNSSNTEPYAFTEYIRLIGNRFHSKHFQITFLRVTPIGKEFFMITSFFIVSAVASYGSFGKILLQLNHQLHLFL